MGELRLPVRILSFALADKETKALRLLASAKLEGHRSQIKPLCECLKIQPKTCQRLVKKIVAKGWAGTDGTFLFPRSWRKLKLSKLGGLYMAEAPNDLKKFEAQCLAIGLKRIYRRAGSSHSAKRRILQTNFPAGFLCKSLGLKERRFKTLKALAQRYKFISVIPQVRIIGKASEFDAIKKNIHGPIIFKRGKHTVVPEVSKIRVLI